MSSNATAFIIARLQSIPGDVAAVGLAFGLIIVPLGLFGNVLVVTTVCVDRSLRKKTNVFIVSMAVADTVMLLCRDVFMVDTYVRRHWAWGGNMVIFHFIMSSWRQTLGLEHVVAITIYRYILIVHNQHYRKIAKTCVMVCVLLFIYTFPLLVAIASITPIFDPDTDVSTYMVYRTKSMTVMTTARARDLVFGQMNFTAIDSNQTSTASGGGGALPYLLSYILLNAAALVLCYIHIFVFLRRSARRVQSWGDKQANKDDKKSAKKKDREVKVVQMMAVVFGAFLVAYIPLPLVSALDHSDSYSYAVYLPFVILNWFSSCSNWLLYAAANPFFRKAFARILGRKGRQANEESNSITQTTNT